MRKEGHFKKLIFTLSLATLLAPKTYALPIDWHGAFGSDWVFIDSYRKTKDVPTGNDAGSQALSEAVARDQNAAFQSYVFRLNPSIIVNDSITVLGEMTTGYARGGFLGDSSATQKSSANNATNARTNSQGLYFHNTTNGAANLHVNKFYLELYTDTATIMLGRHPMDWGLGILYSGGNDVWERFSSIRDGGTFKFKINNFYITPHWAKINSTAQLVGSDDVTDFGLQFLYDNPERDLAVGFLFGRRIAKSADRTQTGAAPSNLPLSSTTIDVVDLYVKKAFRKFTVGAEAIPIMKGDIGQVFSPVINTKYKGSAYILETAYKLNERWSVGLNGGMVSGADGNYNQFSALYLHPNYQIANLMFRYNMRAVTNNALSIYDASITNTNFLKLYGEYNDDIWVWKAALIYAEAKEVAKANGIGYNHTTHSAYGSIANQEKDYGYEVDAGVDYNWNTNLTFGLDAGYHFVGDYFAFTNNATVQTVKDSFIVLGKVGVNF